MRVAPLSVVDRVRFCGFLTLRGLLGFVVLERWALVLFGWLGAGRVLNGFTAGIAHRYDDPDALWADLKFKRFLVLVSTQAIDAALASPANTADPWIKKAAVQAFAPNALTISTLPELPSRRAYNECVLGFRQPGELPRPPRHADAYASIVDAAVRSMPGGRMRWRDFQRLARVISHQVMFGAGESEPAMARRMSRMTRAANALLPLIWTRKRFARALDARMAAARHGKADAASLVAESARCLGAAGGLDVSGQASFWFFVLQDALELHVARTLVLIVSSEPARRSAVDEARNLARPLADRAPISHIECCVRESLRLWTPVPLLLRRVIGPMDILSDVGLRTDDWMLIDAAAHHRNEARFGDGANRFDPFAIGSDVFPKTYYFSDGLQSCAGQYLAMHLVVQTIAALLQRFDFQLVGARVDPMQVPHLFDHYGVEFDATPRPGPT
jgi:cytochrome P450